MRSRRPLKCLGVLLLAGGCDIPTEPPIVEQQWILPLDEVTLDQSELLPPSITISGSTYDVNVDPVAASERLDNLCPGCVPFDGQSVPVPAFSGTFSSTDALPLDVVEVDVVGGAIDVTITNGFSFDPIEGGGTLTITVAGESGGAVLGSLVLDGNTDTMPPGSMTTRTVTLSGGTITGTETTVDVVSVGGQVATIDVTDQVTLSAVTTSLSVGSATVDVDGLTASLSEEPLDVADLQQSLIDGIVSGSALLEVTNPFGVTFDGSVTVGTVVKPFTFGAAAASADTISFTGDELRSFLGQTGVTLSGSGTIGGGPATVTPVDGLLIDASIDLLLELGS